MVYDTSLPTIVPPAATVQAAAAPVVPNAEATAQARVRDTFAQFVPAESKKLEPQVQRKRKVAKVRANPPVRVAQQSPFGFFGGPGWTTPGKAARASLSRQLWNFFRKSIVAGQPLVFLFLETALGDAFRGRCLRLGLR